MTRGPMVWACLLAAGIVLAGAAVHSGNALTAGEMPPSADSVAFREHVISAEASFVAVAAIDVNADGKLDIVSGGWWYEAPTWRRHFLREVEFLGGRYDDYSHQVLDVNRDGRSDLVSCNYRSRKIYWLENTGRADQPWPRHVIAEPGPMETGRLVDVDGDGQPDLLPNGVQFAAWWRIAPAENAGQAAAFLRQDLPVEVAGHGIGFGDLDGDGRGDVVGPRGFAAAPADRRTGRWVFRPEFRLHRDASIPILVTDVDGDGDQDLIWGRGHQFGLYWLEQRTDEGRRTWRQHTIDSSWSQCHAPFLADLDGDGRTELVAGKRYLGHEGRDPGEYDALRSYRYRFDRTTRSWQRWPIVAGTQAGFGLDPKAVDLDGDGDLDLLTADRHGLHWLENLGPPGPAPQPVVPATPAYPDHQTLTHYRTAAGESRPIATPFDWAVRREHLVAGLEQAMGPLPGPERRVPLDVRVEQETETPKYLRRKVSFQAEAGDRVPAWLLLPKDPPRNPAPAMLCLHQTTRFAKDEPAGLGGLPNLHYAHELAELGYVCLVPDYPSFGEYPYDFATAGQHYASGSLKAVWNNLRAVDLLEALPLVDPDRIGVIGHSLGGHNAIFTAVFDPRLKAVVTSCGFTGFGDYYGGNLAGWTSARYMPRIKSEYQNSPARVPFDFHELVAAIAPRGFFTNSPDKDDNFSQAGVKKVIAAAEPVYALLGAGAKLRAEYPSAGHDFPPDVRQAAYAWLAEMLK